MKESDHQKLLWKWAKQHPICCDYLFAIPNGGIRPRHFKEITNLKAQGLRAGVADMFLAYPNHWFAGLWIELKKDYQSEVSEAQLVWLERMVGVGYEGRIAYGHKEAIAIIEEYLE